MLAHIVAPAGMPLWLEWPFAAALFGGATAAVVLRDVRVRLAAVVLSAVGLAGTVTSLVAAPSLPAPPVDSITVAQPADGATVGSAFTVTVCGRRGGRPADVPGSGAILAVQVDGVETVTNTARAVLSAGPGPHTLRIDVLTADHRAFVPPLHADRSITVRAAASSAPASCPA